MDFCRKEKADKEDPNSIFCAGGFDSKDTCTGDSGGPVTLNRNKLTYFLIGITSYGNPICARDLQQGIYTNVSYYVDWIVDNLEP